MKTLTKIEKQKKATVADLAAEIDVIKNNHLAHIHDCIHRLEDDVKDNRKFFTDRLDRLDNRIWWVLGLTITTLIAIVVERMI
jgi:hypothetical protein